MNERTKQLLKLTARLEHLEHEISAANRLPNQAKYRVQSISMHQQSRNDKEAGARNAIIDQMRSQAIETEVAAANVARSRELKRIAFQIDDVRAALCDAAAKSAVELGGYSRQLREDSEINL
jgi:hypothetical protein